MRRSIPPFGRASGLWPEHRFAQKTSNSSRSVKLQKLEGKGIIILKTQRHYGNSEQNVVQKKQSNIAW